MTRIAFYPGSFDPVTNGHVDILRGALLLADSVVVGVGINAGKSPMFDVEGRLKMVHDMIRGLGRKVAGRVSAVRFSGLSVDAARQAGAMLLVRGLRDSTDFDYEMQMAGMNGTMAPDVQTIFLPSSPEVRHITATLVRQIAAMGGDISPFVPASVVRRVQRKFAI